MSRLVNPDTGRTFEHESLLGMLIQWLPTTRDGRIGKTQITSAILGSKRVQANADSLALVRAAAIAELKGGGKPFSMNEQQAVENVLVFLTDRNVRRAIAREGARATGRPMRDMVKELWAWRSELLQHLREIQGPVRLN